MSFCFSNNLVFVKWLHRSLHPHIPADGVPIHSHSVLQGRESVVWDGPVCETAADVRRLQTSAINEREMQHYQNHTAMKSNVLRLHGRKETNYRALTAGSIARRAGCSDPMETERWRRAERSQTLTGVSLIIRGHIWPHRLTRANLNHITDNPQR